MSFDTHRNYVYQQHGKQLRLYRYNSTSSEPVDSKGRVGSDGTNEFIYPDETISDGLRIEYTSLLKPFVDVDPNVLVAGENPTLVEEESPTESSHLNLNRMLSLSVIEYVKAQLAERAGNLDAKEYFMRQFYNKLSDNNSNKSKVYISSAVSPFAL